VSEFSKN